MNELLGQRVNFDEARINSTVESAEFGDKSDIPLLDGSIWVRTDDAARNSSQEADKWSESIDW